MTDDPKPLSPRHQRFVAEYLADLNATQAYLRAGYAPRYAQANASKLLQRPDVQAAVAAGRKRIAQALEVTAERMAAEYARIAFANVDDFVTVDEAGRVRVDLARADRAQRAGLLELTVTDYGEGRAQRVRIKLGKLQALDALARRLDVFVARPEAPDMTAEDRERLEDDATKYRRMWHHELDQKERLEKELREARAALEAAGLDVPTAAPAAPPPLEDVEEPPPEDAEDPGPPDAPDAPAYRQMPGMPRNPPPEFDPGPLRGSIRWVSRRPPERDPDHDPYKVLCDYDPYAYFSQEDEDP